MEWYNSLWKPSWTPAPATMRLDLADSLPGHHSDVWLVFLQAFRNKLPWTVAVPFSINLAANLIFAPIQFGMRNLPLAAVDLYPLSERTKNHYRTLMPKRYVN
jgi:tryptophan-rich sensory protein